MTYPRHHIHVEGFPSWSESAVRPSPTPEVPLPEAFCPECKTVVRLELTHGQPTYAYHDAGPLIRSLCQRSKSTVSTTAYADARAAHAVEQERARVVAWVGRQQFLYGQITPDVVIKGIQRGDHLPTEESPHA